ncbi:response regulator transcription factor [Bordetella genomosp. 9]|uniref:DNA-binding response regulator n=1 Tax=Bordetella genomosp. 9 TaxID=1416803 RepID=A0A1W6YVR4_9BORD|nr:response regulator transcription factor [Bordetella genomosp. 9]ARP85101.1 hypothetical protein CAL13_01865 [Bordetella genomosp. 9]
MNWKTSLPLRVAVLDDHPVVLKGLEQCLAKDPRIQVAGLFRASVDLLEHLGRSPADLLLIDYVLGPGDIDGLNLIRLLRSRHPATAIVVASGLRSPATISLALRAGASGYVSKDRPMSEVSAAIRAVASGKRYVSEPVAAEIGVPMGEAGERIRHRPADPLVLTSREHEVLRCLLEGDSVSEIAAKFSRSIKTISTQKTSAFRKLGLRSLGELYKLRNHVYDLLGDGSPSRSGRE